MPKHNTPEQRDEALAILKRTFPSIRWKVKTTWIETTIHGLFLCCDWNQNGNLHIRFDDGHLTGRDPEWVVAELRRRMETRLAALQAALAPAAVCTCPPQKVYYDTDPEPNDDWMDCPVHGGQEA